MGKSFMLDRDSLPTVMNGKYRLHCVGRNICKVFHVQYIMLSPSIFISYCDENGTQSCTDRKCFKFCSYPVAPGTCDDRVRNYFFNSESRQCEAFIYSGCGGNENRFSSNLDCLHACNPDSQSDYIHLTYQLFTFLTFTLSAGVCLSERYEGEQCNDQDDSEARNEYYYYDSDDGECKTMMAYQCGEARNKNHFPNLMACLNACDPTSK